MTSIAIVNPGFQADNYATPPGYNGGANPAQPTGWTQTGGGGVNGADLGAGAAFSDGASLDGTRVGFIQGAGSISQALSGLVTGRQYYVQGYVRGRNCCGDTPLVSVSFGGTTLLSNLSVGSGNWVPFSLPFTATASSGTFQLSSVASAGGDASLAYDGITMFQLDPGYIPLWNPSFEAGGTSFGFPGYTATGGSSSSNMAGWTLSGPGNVGYNYAGNNPFADNGAVPEGQAVGFIQNDATLSQMVSGLTTGQQYLLELDYNARSATGQGRFIASLGGTTLVDDTFTPNGTYRHLAAVWTATGTSALLSLSGASLTGDNAVVFDNVTLRVIPEPAASALLSALFAAGLLRRRR